MERLFKENDRLVERIDTKSMADADKGMAARNI